MPVYVSILKSLQFLRGKFYSCMSALIKMLSLFMNNSIMSPILYISFYFTLQLYKSKKVQDWGLLFYGK